MPPHEGQTLAHKYCAGQGIELGASRQNRFGLIRCLNVAPSDGVGYLHPEDLIDYALHSKEQRLRAHSVAPVDLIGEFRDIPLPDQSQDYLISTDVFEREPNPVAALIESSRVLKDDGVFYCIFPKRSTDKTRDIFRALSTLDELIEAWREERLATAAAGEPWRGRCHVYSLQSMLRLINWANGIELTAFLIEAVEETDSQLGNGHTVILRKMGGKALREADAPHRVADLTQRGHHKEALLAAKASLSFDAFQPEVLNAAALLSVRLGALAEGREFYRQCLLLDPENAGRRKEFFRLFGEYWLSPLS